MNCTSTFVNAKSPLLVRQSNSQTLKTLNRPYIFNFQHTYIHLLYAQVTVTCAMRADPSAVQEIGSDDEADDTDNSSSGQPQASTAGGIAHH